MIVGLVSKGKDSVGQLLKGQGYQEGRRNPLGMSWSCCPQEDVCHL